MLKPDLVKEAQGLPFIAFLRGWSEGQGGRQTALSLAAGATGCQQGYKTCRCWAPRKDAFPPPLLQCTFHTNCCVNHPKSPCVLRRIAALSAHSLGKEDNRRDQEEKADTFLSDPAVNPQNRWRHTDVAKLNMHRAVWGPVLNGWTGNYSF